MSTHPVNYGGTLVPLARRPLHAHHHNRHATPHHSRKLISSMDGTSLCLASIPSPITAFYPCQRPTAPEDQSVDRGAAVWTLETKELRCKMALDSHLDGSRWGGTRGAGGVVGMRYWRAVLRARGVVLDRRRHWRAEAKR